MYGRWNGEESVILWEINKDLSIYIIQCTNLFTIAGTDDITLVGMMVVMVVEWYKCFTHFIWAVCDIVSSTLLFALSCGNNR